MRRAALFFACTSTLCFAWSAACGGRSPFVDRDGPDGAAGSAGDTGGGGTGGAGGGEGATAGAAGFAGTGGTGGTPIDPIGCLTCVGTSCPQVLACVTDTNCLQGTVCAVQNCLGGGTPDLFCVADCFGGDLTAALAALESLTCIFGTCGDFCGGAFPFPGGGPPGGG